MKKRLLAAGGAIGIGLFLILGRLVQLSVIHNDELARQATNQHKQRITLATRRGAIVDRSGEPLALSIPAESLYVRPRHLPTDIDTFVPQLASALRIPTQEVKKPLRSAAPFVWLKRRATPQEAIQVRALGISGVEGMETERRFYPQGALAAPVLGFTNVDAQGMEGIERAYDRYLRGEPTQILGERDALGRTIFAQGGESPPEALNVRLTLDLGLQYIAEQELGKAVRTTRAEAGTVIILDPQTFAILALAQVPTFDPNTPAAGRPEERRNRALSDVYEPGSTLKTLLAAAALDTNRVRLEEKIFCERGNYQVGKYTINDHHPYEWLTFMQVLQYSSNIGAAKIGERLGKDVYGAYLQAFGLGRVTGLGVPAESPGLLPSPHSWARINLVTASFGQGVAVTPLQLACAYAALANDGVLMRPYIVHEVFNEQGRAVVTNSPQRLWQAVRTETAHRVVGMLEKVVEREGTGWRAQVEGFRVAGKTGTSQKVSPAGGYSRGRIASFVGIVPADRPRLVILVAIDEPKTGVYGGAIAAPVFQTIARRVLAQLGIEGNTPKVELVATTPALATAVPVHGQSSGRQVFTYTTTFPAAGEAGTPNFLGMSLREAVLTAQHNGWHITTSGSGYVTRQTVRDNAGEPVYALTLTPAGEVRP
jgi:cell division protein FtsI (penicillin-binding protein 3)